MFFQKDQKSEHDQDIFYKNIPKGFVDIEDFNLIAYERIQILYAIEFASFRHPKNTLQYYDNIDLEIRKLKKEIQTKQPFILKYTEEFRDLVSHYILRLCFCKTDDLRKWFVNNELEYFKYKLQMWAVNTSSFTHKNNFENLDYEIISSEEKTTHLKNIINSSHKASHVKLQEPDMEFVKINFYEVPELLRKRRVFILNGKAYIPKYELIHLLSRKFRIHLSYIMTYTHNYVNSIVDKRLLRLIQYGEQLYLHGAENSNNISNAKWDDLSKAEKITATDIEDISISFPPCMQHLYQNLKKDSKLKHWGRMQFGLFLKGIGMPLNESLLFWQKAFSKDTSSDDFQKNYAYNIRHMYGKEGKKADYSSYNCVKIITNVPPGPGEYHGCPFKHFDGQSLRQKLKMESNQLALTNQKKIFGKLNDSQIDEIITLAKVSHYQISCSKYFSYKHNVDIAKAPAINHPNQFFSESRKSLKLQLEK